MVQYIVIQYPKFCRSLNFNYYISNSLPNLENMYHRCIYQETSKAEVLRICGAMDEMMDESKDEGTTPGRPGNTRAK